MSKSAPSSPTHCPNLYQSDPIHASIRTEATPESLHTRAISESQHTGAIPTSQQMGPQKKIVCHTCQAEGHKSPQCPLRGM